jgi:pantoate--beta-alanine ligase
LITLTTIAEIQSRLVSFRDEKRSVGLVPTMGFLHEGHLSLIRKAKSENDAVVVSIFVNPTQFAPHEDLDRYPRDLEKDTKLAQEAGCDLMFVPAIEEMYPNDFSSYAVVEGMSTVLEGKFRPTHFKGVTTVVLKLFNFIQPSVAYFGQKDAQQSILIKKMVKDLNVPVRISIVPTMRETDGLAMSSRNVYLDPEQRRNSVMLYKSLKFAEKIIAQGERDPKKVIDQMKEMILANNPSQIDYIEIVDAENLETKNSLNVGETVLIPLAVRFGSTRLIDNIVVSV